VSLDWEKDDVCLVLEDEEGQEHEFALVKKFCMDDDEYVVLQPVDADEQIIFKFITDEDGAEFLCEIEDEEEWERAVDAYQGMGLDEEI